MRGVTVNGGRALANFDRLRVPRPNAKRSIVGEPTTLSTTLRVGIRPKAHGKDWRRDGMVDALIATVESCVASAAASHVNTVFGSPSCWFI
jgi:hypothetical protein